MMDLLGFVSGKKKLSLISFQNDSRRERGYSATTSSGARDHRGGGKTKWANHRSLALSRTRSLLPFISA
jgi:hypothetical protein